MASTLQGQREGAKESGLNIVLDEGYSATAPDLSSLNDASWKRGAGRTWSLHTGYNPDISLFLRQARELGLRFSALVGHGAGYTDYTRIKQDGGHQRHYFLRRRSDLDLGHQPQIASRTAADDPDGRRCVHLKAKPDTIIKSPHVGMAPSTHDRLHSRAARAITKYGGVER